MGYADLIVHRLIGMKLCTTLMNGDPFFLGGNFVRAPHGLLLRTIIPASSSSGKIRFANSLSSAVYLGNEPWTAPTGSAFGSRSIECSMRSVALISLMVAANQSFHVYSMRRVRSIRSGVSAFWPIVMPLSSNHALIISDGASDRGL